MSLFKTRKANKDIDLIFSSSGVRAPCFIGGLEAILEKGYNIHRIAGTSGGAIVAAGHALGKSTQEMEELALQTPYAKFKDFRIKNLLNLRNPSVYAGQELDKFYKKLFGKAKLKDFKIDCRIAVITIIGRERKFISRDTHPDLLVWKAVRMSSTIPFIFPYLKLDGKAVTDGGLYTHMSDIFPNSSRQVVCLRPRADHGIKKVVQDVKVYKLFVWNYLKIVAEYFIDAADNQHVPDEEWGKTIVMPTFEIGGFNFELEPPAVGRLIRYGYNAVIHSDILPHKN
jgi:NTE family protein